MHESKLVAKVIYDEADLLYMPMIVPILHSFCDAVEVYALDDSKTRIPAGLMTTDMRLEGDVRDCYQQALNNTALGTWVMFWNPYWLPTNNLVHNLKYILTNNRQTGWDITRYYATDIVNKQLMISTRQNVIKNFVFKYHANMAIDDSLKIIDNDLIKGQPMKASVGVIELNFALGDDKEPLPKNLAINTNINWLMAILRQQRDVYERLL